MDLFLTRPTRALLEEERPVHDAIMSDPDKSVTEIKWGPSFFDQMDMIYKTITQNAKDRHILLSRWAYGYRLDPENNPTQITWLDVDDSRLTFANILSGTPNERTDMQVKCVYTVDGVPFLPAGCTSFSQEEYIESIRING